MGVNRHMERSLQRSLDVPLLEELSGTERRPLSPFKRGETVTESFLHGNVVKNYLGSLDTKAGRDSRVSRVHFLSRQLISLGFKEEMVFALLEHVDVTDSDSAIDMLIKTPQGWSHSFVSGPSHSSCKICNEPYQEHVEATRREEVSGPLEWTIEDSGREEEQEVRITTSRLDILSQSEERRSPTQSCAICMSMLRSENEFALSCGHVYCRTCIAAYLEAKILSGEVRRIECPSGDCDLKFRKGEIAGLCVPSLYERYQRYKQNIKVNLDTRLRWCSAANCGRFVEGSLNVPHVVCVCGFHMCFVCGEAWHAGTSCASNYERLYRNWAKDKKIQRCPNCQIRIEKDQGCNHIRCTFCSYQWCWVCGQKYESGHFDNTLFGCPLVQFTATDWSLGRIALYQLLVLLFWPVLCLLWSYSLVAQWVWRDSGCWAEAGWLLTTLLVAMIILAGPIVAAAVFVPTFVYRIYILLFVIVRSVRHP